jgi:hypothetical protein
MKLDEGGCREEELAASESFDSSVHDAPSVGRVGRHSVIRITQTPLPPREDKSGTNFQLISAAFGDTEATSAITGIG